jgi:hypothetical protein
VFLPAGLRFFAFRYLPKSKIFLFLCVLRASNEQSEWVVKKYQKKVFHHGDTEGTEKLFFDLPGDGGKSKAIRFAESCG